MAEQIIPLTSSLVQYDNPVLVTSHEVVPKSPRPGTSAAEENKETEEILNSILPPKQWEEDGNLWMQQVCNIFIDLL